MRFSGGTFTQHRYLIAAVCAGLAVVLFLNALAPRRPPQVPLLVASHDLPSGHQLVPDDVREVAFPAQAVPVGALRAADPLPSLPLAAPVRAGEPLTDVRFDSR